MSVANIRKSQVRKKPGAHRAKPDGHKEKPCMSCQGSRGIKEKAFAERPKP